MKILLIGYGKMGQTIEKIAIDRGHEIVGRIAIENQEDLAHFSGDNVDVAIEFTQPEAAFENLKIATQNGIKVVCGTTGWLENKPVIEQLVKENNTAFLYASNFSIGVNVFFYLNKVLAKVMNPFKGYDVRMEEIHHTQKLDAPSGTAITLAEGIIENYSNKKNWVNNLSAVEDELTIVSVREGQVPGTHTVWYNSEIDEIEIKHTAHNRNGFALGAVVAAEWISDKQGTFTMDDVLDIKL